MCACLWGGRGEWVVAARGRKISRYSVAPVTKMSQVPDD
jgi:hypothetical protein